MCYSWNVVLSCLRSGQSHTVRSDGAGLSNLIGQRNHVELHGGRRQQASVRQYQVPSVFLFSLVGHSRVLLDPWQIACCGLRLGFDFYNSFANVSICALIDASSISDTSDKSVLYYNIRLVSCPILSTSFVQLPPRMANVPTSK